MRSILKLFRHSLSVVGETAFQQVSLQNAACLSFVQSEPHESVMALSVSALGELLLAFAITVMIPYAEEAMTIIFYLNNSST
jgi:hypothetical protein